MSNSIIDAIEKEYLKAEVPAFNVGDVVKVGVTVVSRAPLSQSATAACARRLPFAAYRSAWESRELSRSIRRVSTVSP